MHEVIDDKFLRRHGKRFYTTHLRVFLKWFRNKPETCTHNDAKMFLNFLAKKGNSNTTINHYRNTLKTLYSELVKEKKMKQNPFEGFKKLPESRVSKKYFTPQQVAEIKQYLLQHEPELWLACQFIYYCFIRPNELRQLQIKDIDFYNLTVTVPGSISKNRQTQTVVVPSVFYEDVGLLAKHGNETYIIGKGVVPVGDTWMSDKFRYAMNVLGYDNRYSLYSFKHTGAMMFVKATKDVKALQMQLRHHSLDMVNEYLKNMGAIDNTEVRNNFPAI